MVVLRVVGSYPVAAERAEVRLATAATRRTEAKARPLATADSESPSSDATRGAST
jgi:hypothetical protein